MFEDMLLWSSVGVYPNCHKRGLIQELMGADEEICNQTLRRARGIVQKRERKDCRNERFEDTRRTWSTGHIGPHKDRNDNHELCVFEKVLCICVPSV